MNPSPGHVLTADRESQCNPEYAMKGIPCYEGNTSRISLPCCCGRFAQCCEVHPTLNHGVLFCTVPLSQVAQADARIAAVRAIVSVCHRTHGLWRCFQGTQVDRRLRVADAEPRQEAALARYGVARSARCLVPYVSGLKLQINFGNSSNWLARVCCAGLQW